MRLSPSPRSSIWPVLALGMVLAALPGCQSKSIRLDVAPVDAVVEFQEYRGGQPYGNPERVAVNPQTSAIERTLTFDKDGKFVVRAHRKQYYDAVAEITYEPQSQTNFRLDLKRYKQNLATLAFRPEMGEGNALHLVANSVETEAYLDEIEPSAWTASCEKIMVSSEFKDLHGLAISPTDDLLAFVSVREISPGVTHRSTGQTLGEIAAMHKVNTDDLLRRNNLPSGSPDYKIENGTILKIRDRELASAMHTLRPGTAAYTRIIEDRDGTPYLDLYPAFGPTGDFVAFSTNRYSRNLTLARVGVNKAGSAITRVTNGQNEDYAPHTVEGPIAYNSLPQAGTPNPAPRIWVVAPNGGDLTQIGPEEGESPRVSPDGKLVAYLRRDPKAAPGQGVKQIWIRGMDGTGVRQLTLNTAYDIRDLSWHPRGEWLAFASNQGAVPEAKDARVADPEEKARKNWDLYALRVDQPGQFLRLTENGAVDDQPVWDRQGSFLYFRSNRGGAWGVWRLAPKPLPAAK